MWAGRGAGQPTTSSTSGSPSCSPCRPACSTYPGARLDKCILISTCIYCYLPVSTLIYQYLPLSIYCYLPVPISIYCYLSESTDIYQYLISTSIYPLIHTSIYCYLLSIYCHLPRLLWKTAEGGVMKIITSGLTDITAFMDKGARTDGVELIAKYYNVE